MKIRFIYLSRFWSLSIVLVLASCLTFTGERSDDAQLIRIGFGSCLHQLLPQPIWSPIFRRSPDVFIFMGDNWYAPDGDLMGLRKAARTFQANPSVTQLRRSAAVFATWDDHDYGLNDAGAELSTKEEARKVFVDVFPMNDCKSRDLSDAGVYRECVVERGGVTIQILLLDTRSFRSPLVRHTGSGAEAFWYQPNPDPGATMLGSDQWLWLEESVRKPADLRVIVSSVQVIPDEHPFEKWGNFPLEQQRFLKLLCEAPLTSTVLLSGVRHSSEISAWSCPSGRTLLELTSSSLNVPIVGKRRFPNRFRVGSEVLEANVGFLVVTARASGLSEVTGQILGTNGQILDQMTIIDKKGTL